MAIIGTFTKVDNGFTGAVKTLSLNVKTVKFVPAEGDSERGPDFRILASATVEFGAAWKKTARETQREYLSVKLDDQASPRRFTPAWSRPRTARVTTSSGPAATAIEAGPSRSPAHPSGASS